MNKICLKNIEHLKHLQNIENKLIKMVDKYY